MTKEEMIVGLKSGRTLVVDRKDAYVLPWLGELHSEGKVTSEFVEYDDQSSALKFRWVEEKP